MSQFEFHVWPDGTTGFYMAKCSTHDLVVRASSTSGAQRQVINSFAEGAAGPSDSATFVSHDDASTVPEDVIDHVPGYLTGE